MNIFLLVFIFLYPTLTTAYVFFPWITRSAILIQIILTVWIIYRFLTTLKYKSRKIYFSQLSKKIYLLIIVFLLLNIVSLIRGYFSNFINANALVFYVTMLTFFYFVGLLASVGSENEVVRKDTTFSVLCLGIAFYMILNLFILYILQIQSPFVVENRLGQNQLGEGVIGALLGLELKRTIFPLSASYGITHLASIVGIVVVESSIRIIYRRNTPNLSFFNTLSNYISAILCFFALLILDTRAALISVILVLAFFFVINLKKSHFKLNISYTPLIFIANYSFSFIFHFVSDFLQPLLQEYGMNRSSSTSSFTEREIIWDSVLTFFSAFDPEHIIGYGMWGQYKSGLNAAYESSVFSNYFNQRVRFFSLHSTIFQQMIDIGYLSLFIYLSLTLLSVISLVNLIKISRDKLDVNHTYAIPNLACILYLAIVGNFDPVVTQERVFTTGIYFLLVMSSLGGIKPNAK